MFSCQEQVSRAISSFTKVFDANCYGIADEDGEDDDNEGTHIDAESNDDINIPASTMDVDHCQISFPFVLGVHGALSGLRNFLCTSAKRHLAEGMAAKDVVSSLC